VKIWENVRLGVENKCLDLGRIRIGIIYAPFSYAAKSREETAEDLRTMLSSVCGACRAMLKYDNTYNFIHQWW